MQSLWTTPPLSCLRIFLYIIPIPVIFVVSIFLFVRVFPYLLTVLCLHHHVPSAQSGSQAKFIGWN